MELVGVVVGVVDNFDLVRKAGGSTWLSLEGGFHRRVTEERHFFFLAIKDDRFIFSSGSVDSVDCEPSCSLILYIGWAANCRVMLVTA